MALETLRRSLRILLIAGLAIQPAVWGDGGVQVGAEHWYRLDVGGAPAGWMVERDIQRGDELITESVLHVSFQRGPDTAELEMASRFIETAEGQPLSAWSRQQLGALPTETSYEFLADGIAVTRRQGEEVSTDHLPAPAGEWATPRHVDREVREWLSSGSETFVIRTIDPAMGMTPVELEWVLEARAAEVMVDGRPRQTSRWSQSLGAVPDLVTTVDVAADGLLVRSSTSLMGLDMVMTLSNRDAVIELRGTTELLAQSFIYPDRAIDRPREVVRAVYELTVDEGFLPNVPSIGDQRAKNSRGRARVTVELGSSPKVDPRTVDVAEYLRASTYLNHRDPKLGELRAQALDPVETTDPAVRAEALRELVHAHLVKKDLNTLLATASEVATTRAGDCTEHAVLLAALLRADGIPSRVVTGLVYVDRFVGEVNLFGYHMWTQAFLDGRWIDLDATLGRRFDATHIAFTHTSLNDEGVALLQMAKITPLMGRLEVKVLEVDHAPEAEVAGESR